MKHSNALPAYLVILLLSILYACEPVAKIQVLQPAAVVLPGEVHAIVIINRSIPENNFGKLFEDVLLFHRDISMEPSGRRQAVSGLSKSLANIPRFKVIFSGIEMKTSAQAYFTDPLPWTTVDSICKAYSCDAIAALEYYQAATRTSKSQREITSKDKDKNEVKSTEYTVEKTSTITLGWRLYDSKTHTIRDQFADEKSGSWSKTVNTESEYTFLQMESNVNQISYAAGAAYGDRFTILEIMFSRQYYGKGSALMKTAKAKSIAGDWDGAIGTWKDILSKGDKELAGKAAYNIAVACEVKGNLDVAREWADKSYSECGNEKAKEYLSVIDARIEDRKQLNEQIKEERK